MKMLNALILSYIKNIFVGCIGILIIVIMIRECDAECKFISFLGFNLINLFICFVYSIIFLFPLAHLQQEQIKSKDLTWLFKNYLPLITIIPATGFCLLFVNCLGKVKEEEQDLLLCVPAVLLCQQAVALWQFLKSIKKQVE